MKPLQCFKNKLTLTRAHFGTKLSLAVAVDGVVQIPTSPRGPWTHHKSRPVLRDFSRRGFAPRQWQDPSPPPVRSTWLVPVWRWDGERRPVGSAIKDEPRSKRPLCSRKLGCKLRRGASVLEELLLQILLPCPCCVSEVSCRLLLSVQKRPGWWGKGFWLM